MAGRVGVQIVPPNCILAEGRDEREMRFSLLRAKSRRERERPRPDARHANRYARRHERALHQNELSLPGSDQFQIDFRQDLGVEQRAMLGALAFAMA